MFKFDVYFRNIEVINYFYLEKVYKLHCWLRYHANHILNTKIIQIFNRLCRMVLDAVCTHVTSSAASRYSAVKLTTD